MKTPMDSSTRVVALNFLATLLSGIQYNESNKASVKQSSSEEESDDEDDVIKCLVEVLDAPGKKCQLSVQCEAAYLSSYLSVLWLCIAIQSVVTFTFTSVL